MAAKPTSNGKPSEVIIIEARSDEDAAQTPRLLHSDNLPATIWTSANMFSSIAVVMVNKIVFKQLHFMFPLLLCSLHTLTTVIGLRLCALRPAVLQPQAIPTYNRWLMGSVYAAFVVSSILSIQLNPVGFYQVTRSATTPCVVFFELLLHCKVPSARVVMSIILLLFGVTMCTVLDFGVKATSAQGVIVAISSTIISAYHQVLAGAQQKELHVSGIQLLHECTPPAALIMAILVPFIDNIGFGDSKPGTLLAYRPSLSAMLVIGCSALLGFLVMLSAFQMIGLTSALTYNVVGYSKTILIVLGGWLLFDDHMSGAKALAVGLAIAGVISYSYLRCTEVQEAQVTRVEDVQHEEKQQLLQKPSAGD